MNYEPIYKHYTRGGQISFHNIRMWQQITKTLINVGILFFILSVSIIVVIKSRYETLLHAIFNQWSILMEASGHDTYYTLYYKDHVVSLPTKTIATHPYFIESTNQVIANFYDSLFMAGLISCLFSLALTIFFIQKGRLQSRSEFVRGGKLIKASILKKQIQSSNMASDITIDNFPLIKNSETRHMLIHGTVGQGKSQLIMKLLDNLRRRGDRVIIYDKGHTFTEVYFRESKDKILNPYDKRCANWDLWSEAPVDTLLENMAESLIPIHGENDPFWVNAARTVFSSAASKMRTESDRSLRKLLRLLVTGEIEALEPYLNGTPAATLVNNKIEKTAISILSVLTTYLKSLMSLADLEGESFCIRDYILNEENSGWLFISSNGEHHKSLKPLISMWIAMASLTLLSLKEDNNRRIWFICDELPSLHKLPLLGETIAEIRKFGGCFVLGMQSFSQLEKVYGRNGAHEIFDLLNTRAFFKSPSSEMAELVSKELGYEDIEDNRENYSYGANSIRDGISLGKQRSSRPLVTASEIMSLEPMSCFLRLPGDLPITQLDLKLELRDKVAEGFQQRIISTSQNQTIVLPKNSITGPSLSDGESLPTNLEFYLD